jgi:RNA polymerase sigma-70 factor (ECF subfamily)
LSSDLHQELQDLLTEHEAGLVAYTKAICRDLESARDCVQDAFIRFAAAREKGDKIEFPRAWLYRVASHRAYDLLRRRKRENQAREEDRIDQPAEAEAPDLVMELKCRDEALAIALDELGDPARSIVSWRLRCDLSYEEIARRLELNPSHVGVILHRSLKKLRDRFASHLTAEILP